MAVVNKIMKTFNVQNGSDTIQYEIFDAAGRRSIAPDWYENSTSAFSVGDFVMKDGVLYQFISPHAANTPWDASEVEAASIASSMSGKADKVDNATSGNFAGLDSNGNLMDSGHKHSDYLTEHQDISGKLNVSEKGAANGVAELDSNGKVPSSQLPSYVDDVVEGYYYDGKFYREASHTTEIPAEDSKIYIDIEENKTYRWSGSVYVAIGGDLTLGETSSTAYRGDRGKAAYDHASDPNKISAQQTLGFYKVAVTAEGHIQSVSAVQKSDITDLGIPGSHQDISGKADKDTDAVTGNFAEFDANGNPVDSGHKHSDYASQQDLSGKIDSTEKGAANGVATLGADGKVPSTQLPAGQTTISKIEMNGQEVPISSSGVADLGTVITQHQDISGKADKVGNATNGNFAGLNSAGNLTDSGVGASDFLSVDQGSTNAGKFMRVGSTGAVAYDSPTERYASLNDFPATGDEGKLYIAEDTGMIYVWDSEYVPVGGTSSDECEVSGDVVSFETFESKAKKLVVNIDPVQDLHGYDNPWPAGGGKNLLNPTGESGTDANVVYTKATDGTWTSSGTANGTSTKLVGEFDVKSGISYVLNGCPSGGGSASYRIDVRTAPSSIYNDWIDVGSGMTFTPSEDVHLYVYIRAASGTNMSGKTFSPMIRLSSVSDATFAPYSNICPISGWDSANVSRTGKNLLKDIVNLFNSAVIMLGQTDAYWIKQETFFKAGTYTISFDSLVAGGAVWFGNANPLTSKAITTGKNSMQFTVTKDGYYALWLYYSQGLTVSNYSNFMVEVGSTASEYTPYSGTTAEYEFPQSAGTVYGGTLTIHQDWSGELVVDRVDVHVTSARAKSSFSTDAVSIFPLNGTSAGGEGIRALNTDQEETTFISNLFPSRSIVESVMGNQKLVGISASKTSGICYLTVPVSIATTQEEMNAWLSNNEMHVVCNLITPVTYQLTNQQVVSLLKGQNNVWADCGSIDLTYYRTETAYQVSLNTADIAELQGEVEDLQNDFTGATASTDGAHGLVPAPAVADKDKFLKGSGGWAEVPNPQAMTGATASTAGTSGLVPAPAAGDQDKVLYGDGTWQTPGGGTLRVVPFSIGVASWTLSGGVYSCTVSSAYVTLTSVEFIEYDSSYRTAVRGDVDAVKATGGGGVTFTTDVLPVATLSGEIRVFDSDDGKVAIVTQMTALPTMREVPFTVAVSDWALNADDMYEAVFATAFVTPTSHDFVEFDESVENAKGGIKAVKAESSSSVIGIKFTTKLLPVGDISGTIMPLDNADGKVAIALEDTVVSVANGGTGANTIAGAQQNLGITDLINQIGYEERADRISIYGGRMRSITYATYRKYYDGRVELYITGKTASVSSDSITLFSLSGSNPRLEGHIIYGSTGILNACVSLESGKNYIDKVGGAISDNLDYYVHLSGFELP